MNTYEDVVIVADAPPVDTEFILALTPHLGEEAAWAEREQAALAIADAAANGLEASWWAFTEKPVTYEPDGDVIWA